LKIYNSFLVTHDLINLLHSLNGSSEFSSVSIEDYFLIEDLNDYVEYEFAVRAGNMKGNITNAITSLTTKGATLPYCLEIVSKLIVIYEY
jgi:hypothetical protein